MAVALVSCLRVEDKAYITSYTIGAKGPRAIFYTLTFTQLRRGT